MRASIVLSGIDRTFLSVGLREALLDAGYRIVGLRNGAEPDPIGEGDGWVEIVVELDDEAAITGLSVVALAWRDRHANQDVMVAVGEQNLVAQETGQFLVRSSFEAIRGGMTAGHTLYAETVVEAKGGADRLWPPQVGFIGWQQIFDFSAECLWHRAGQESTWHVGPLPVEGSIDHQAVPD